MYRNRKRQEVDGQHNAVNMNRMTKSRAIKKLKNALPSTPVKRVVVLKQYMSSNSPTARTVIKHNGSDCSVTEHVFQNIKEFIKDTKFKRNADARNAMNIISASGSGENISQGGKLVQSKIAICHAAVVMYICTELDIIKSISRS